MKTITLEVAENLTKNSFFKAILILIQKPQVINRKLSCSVNKEFLKINATKEEFLEKISIDEIKSSLEDLIALFDGKISYEVAKLEDLQHADELESSIFVSLNKVLPRNSSKYESCYSIAIIGEFS